jgi:hypothetical protein
MVGRQARFANRRRTDDGGPEALLDVVAFDVLINTVGVASRAAEWVADLESIGL